MNFFFQKFRRLWLLLMALIPLFASAVETINIDGRVYIKNTAIIANQQWQMVLGKDGESNFYELIESTIQMPEGQGAAIEIRGDVVIGVAGYLNVKGGDAKGYIGAGAGIHVPAGASLRIMPALNQSQCTVTATGGNAGKPNEVVTDHKWNKYNNGAGGAGAGIGGNGGNGGTASYAMAILQNKFEDKHYGQPSGACGNIIIDRGVTLTAIGGQGTGVSHDQNGTTVSNFNLVGQENAPINYGYVPAGVKYNTNTSEWELYTDLAYTDGNTLGFNNTAWGSPGGQGGGGGGYPAAGIGGGGSGGGAGGFGSWPSGKNKVTTAAGDGGNAGGGGTGYGINGQFGTSGGYAKFGWGMEHEIICQVGPTEKGPGGYTKVDNQYTGSNGYWGQKNFSGTGHASGQSGSTQLDGVRPGTFLEGGKPGEPVSGSDVKDSGIRGGGVLFDSQCGQIIIRGNVKSYANGGCQPRIYNASLGMDEFTATNIYQPYYINDIGTALPGKENPFTVKIEGGTLDVNRKAYLTFDISEYTPASPADVLEIPIKNYSDNGSYTMGTHRLTWLPDNEARHYRMYLTHSTLYVSQVKDGSFGYLGYYQSDFDDNDPIHSPRFDLTVDASRGWGYRNDGTWGNIRSGQQYFTGRINDDNISKTSVNILRFDACMDWNKNNNNHMWIDDFEIYPTFTSELWQERIAPIDGNTFRARCTGDDVAIKNLRWEPFEVEFSGNGGRAYVLESMTVNSLPVYKNNNTDGTEILGYYTEPVTFENGRMQLHGEKYASISEFVRKGYTKIYVVTWNPATDIISVFTGEGGQNYELISFDHNKLPEYKNNNTDGSEIFGFYTEPATIENGYVIVHGRSFSSIKEFVDNGFNAVYVVTWFPKKGIVAPSAIDKIDASYNGATGVVGAGNRLICKMEIDEGITIKVNPQKESFIMFNFQGYINFQLDDNDPIALESSPASSTSTPIGQQWSSKRIPISAGNHTIKITCLDGQNRIYSWEKVDYRSYLYGMAIYNMLEKDEEDYYLITNSEDLDVVSMLINMSGSENYRRSKFRVVGTVETSENFETLCPYSVDDPGFRGTMTGGTIVLTNNKPLFDRCIDATFTNLTVSGKLDNQPSMVAMGAYRTNFINCKVEGSITSNSSHVAPFCYYYTNKFYGCVSDVDVVSASRGYRAAGIGVGTMQDCIFTGTVYKVSDNGETIPGEPFSYTSSSKIQNCISTFDPGTETIIGESVENVYILSDTEEERGNYSTKTAAQFASGEVGYLLAIGGESNWFTPAGAQYPVYDAATLHNHAHITCDDDLKLTGPRQSTPLHLYGHEGEEFTVAHVAGKSCPIFINNELVSTNGTYTGQVVPGESFVSMRGTVAEGDEFSYNGIKYVIITVPDGDNPGTVKTKSGSKNEENGIVSCGNTELTGDLIIPATVDYAGYSFSVTEIGEYSLGGNVTSISLPETLTTIGDEGINGLNGLTHLFIPASVTSLGNSLYPNHPELVRVEFAEETQITTIPFSAFQSCDGLTSVVIPESVTTIENFAFFRCANLKSVVLSPNTEQFGFLPFGEQTKLRTVIYLSDSPLRGSSVDFDDDTFENAKLYALVSAKEQYQSVDPWKLFANIVWCGVELSKTEVTLNVNNTETLEATVTVPPTMTKSEVVWSTSDPMVATVDENGVVTGVSKGNATITATSGQFSSDCEFVVTDISTGIDAIFADDSIVAVDIYTLQGICIKRNASIDDVKGLSPGYYIIGKQKVYVK